MPWRPMTAANGAARQHHEVHRRVLARQLARHIQEAGARDVARFVVGAAGFRMVRHGLARRGWPQPGGALEDPQIRIAKVRREPVGLDQRIGVVVACHALPLLPKGCLRLTCRQRRGNRKAATGELPDASAPRSRPPAPGSTPSGRRAMLRRETGERLTSPRCQTAAAAAICRTLVVYSLSAGWYPVSDQTYQMKESTPVTSPLSSKPRRPEPCQIHCGATPRRRQRHRRRRAFLTGPRPGRRRNRTA